MTTPSRLNMRGGAGRLAFPVSMVLTPISRCPTRLPEATVQVVLEHSERCSVEPASEVLEAEKASIVIVTFNGLIYTRMCLETVLVNTPPGTYEVIVVDNGSNDGSAEYLERVAAEHPQIRAIRNPENRGFPRA